RRRAELAGSLWALPAARAGAGEPPRNRRVRPRLQSHLELRPVAARTAALAAPLASVHGEVGALLVAAAPPARKRGRIQGPPWPRRPRRDRDGRATGPRGPCDRHVPGR